MSFSFSLSFSLSLSHSSCAPLALTPWPLYVCPASNLRPLCFPDASLESAQKAGQRPLSGITCRSVRAVYFTALHLTPPQGYWPFFCYNYVYVCVIIFLFFCPLNKLFFHLVIPALEHCRKTTIYGDKKGACSLVPGQERS